MSDENPMQSIGCSIDDVGLHQQQQSAGAGKDDGGGASGFRYDGGVSGWIEAALQLRCAGHGRPSISEASNLVP